MLLREVVDEFFMFIDPYMYLGLVLLLIVQNVILFLINRKMGNWDKEEPEEQPRHDYTGYYNLGQSPIPAPADSPKIQNLKRRTPIVHSDVELWEKQEARK